MNKKLILLFICLMTGWLALPAQEKSDLEKRAETEDAKKQVPNARSLYIHAFNDYFNRGLAKQGVNCGVKATALYYKENYFQEAFDLLKRIDGAITASKDNEQDKAGMRYLTQKERMQMYIKMRRSEKAKEFLNNMEMQAGLSGDKSLKNDFLYNKAIYCYTFGKNAEGNAVFKEMADALMKQKEYGKVDEVYQTLIANGRRSNSANLVAQAYSSYIAWKDSANALKHADEINALKEQIANNETEIADKDSSLTTKQVIIVGLLILAAALAAALIFGAIVLMRYIMMTRKQKKTIKLAQESDALKAKFISNIAAQLEPTLNKLDASIPEVKALKDFSGRIQQLSELQNGSEETIENEDTQMQQFCEACMAKIENKVKPEVTLTVNAPKTTVSINKPYVEHIIDHLLTNAAEYTPEGGNIWLDFKKRSPHKYQFVISDTGCGIPEEKQDDVFKPFLEVRDLTTGDGLGLPICKQMAQNMNGDLSIDPQFTKGTRFVLDLNV